MKNLIIGLILGFNISATGYLFWKYEISNYYEPPHPPAPIEVKSPQYDYYEYDGKTIEVPKGENPNVIPPA